MIRSTLTRANLNLVVTRASRSVGTVARIVAELLGGHGGHGDEGGGGGAGGGVIVYCSTQYACTVVAQDLRRKGVAAEPFHAGLPARVRRQTQVN